MKDLWSGLGGGGEGGNEHKKESEISSKRMYTSSTPFLLEKQPLCALLSRGGAHRENQ